MDFWWFIQPKGASISHLVPGTIQPSWPGSFLVKSWIIKNPNFYWFLIHFLLEAVEASQCYFFENQVCLSKIYNLRIPKLLSNKTLLAYFYLSDPIHNVQFNVRYPVPEKKKDESSKICQLLKPSIFKSVILLNFLNP